MWDALYGIAVAPIEMIIEFIFALVNSLFNNPGAAIIFVSIGVQLLVLPMYKQSDALQEQERKKQEEMKPWLEHIKKTFKGDERFMMQQAYYREVGYKPVDAIKGSFSLLLQIPFFMAAYHYLSNLTALQGCPFLFITDLGKPDSLITLGGLTLNLLPILMTLFNVISGIIYTKGFPLKDKIQTYGLAAVFLVLLYQSPSGLVFYWTLNNLFSLFKNIFMKLVKKPRPVINLIAAIGGTAVFAPYMVKYIDWTDNFGIATFFLILCWIPMLLSAAEVFRRKYRKRYELLKEKHIYVHNKTEKSIFNFSSIILTVLFGLVVPLSVVSSSPTEFFQKHYTPVGLILKTCFIMIGFFMVWFRIFYTLSNDKAKHYFACGMAAFTGISIVDFYCFRKALGTLSSDLVFDKKPYFDEGFIILNIIVVIMVAALLSLVFNKKPVIIKRLCQIGTLTLVVVSATGLFGVHNDSQDFRPRKEIKKGEEEKVFTLSKEGQNVVVLMIDRAISGYIPYFMQQKPELLKTYDGFTYYPNTISFGGHTNFGAPALFGGYEYTPTEMNKRTTERLSAKHNEALKMMPKLFGDNGYEVTVADLPYANYSWQTDLSIYKDLDNTKAYITEGVYTSDSKKVFGPLFEEKQKRNFVCYSFMKCAPVVLQNFLYNGGSYYCTKDNDMLNSSFIDSYSVLERFKNLTKIEEGNTNQLLMLQNGTAHEVVRLQEPDYVPKVNCTSSPSDHPEYYVLDGVKCDVSDSYAYKHYQSNMAAILRIGEWLDYLKEEGVYDNTKIIIVADHGYELKQWDYMKINNGDKVDIDVERFNPLLMVKDFNAKGFNTDNSFMTNADVPTLATKDVISNPINPYTGKAISSDAKNTEPMLITTSARWGTNEGNGYTFDTSDGYWASVKDDIFDAKNWKYVKEGEK